MRSARWSSDGPAVRAPLVLALLLVIGLFAAQGAVAEPIAATAHGAGGVPAAATASPGEGVHEHVPLAALVLAGPVGDPDPLWPVCPAPIGHGDSAGLCAVGITPFDALADLPATAQADISPAGALRRILATRAQVALAPSLIALSVSRT